MAIAISLKSLSFNLFHAKHKEITFKLLFDKYSINFSMYFLLLNYKQYLNIQYSVHILKLKILHILLPYLLSYFLTNLISLFLKNQNIFYIIKKQIFLKLYCNLLKLFFLMIFQDLINIILIYLLIFGLIQYFF